MNTDIVVLYQRISSQINNVENNKYNQNILDDLRSDFIELLECIKLFLISERDLYYGYFMMNLNFEINYECNTIAGIKLKSYPPVFETNPLLLCKFSLKNIIYIVCHEIDHIVFNHPTMMLRECKHSPELVKCFNIAADASVNDGINDEIKKHNHNYMEFPKGCITSNVVGELIGYSKILPKQNYKYYFELLKDEKKLEIINYSIPSNSKNKKSSNEDNSSKQSNKIDGNASNSDQGEIITSKNIKEINDHNWADSDDTDEIEQYVRTFVNEVYDTMNEETRGLMSASFKEAIAAINKPPKINWKSVLKKYIGTISANNTKTKTRLNRRQPERFDLSGTKNNKILKIVVAIDTSGSMSNDDISNVLNEILNIIGKRKFTITIIECDLEINRIYTIKSRKDIKYSVLGRGGTCFTPVIEHVNSDRYYRDALLIYFTDGFGENSIPKPKTYRNLWVIINDVKNLSVKNPYGAVIALK